MEFFIYTSDNPDYTLSLGYSSMKNFWPEDGYSALIDLIQSEHPSLSNIIIVNDQGKKYSIENFLDLLKKLIIKKH